MKDEMLSLVPNVITLEAEEGSEPVEEVHTVVPRDERRLAKVPNGANGGRSGSYFGTTV